VVRVQQHGWLSLRRWNTRDDRRTALPGRHDPDIVNPFGAQQTCYGLGATCDMFLIEGIRRDARDSHEVFEICTQGWKEFLDFGFILLLLAHHTRLLRATHPTQFL
jgi:hypothetical protein